MRSASLRLTLAACLLAATAPAQAATARLYTPGGAPCAGACTLPWAADAFNVPTGNPQPLMIPAGTFVEKMSYAKDGVAYWTPDSAIFASEQPAVGYLFRDADGTTKMMVRIAECLNYAVVHLSSYSAISYTAGPAVAHASAFSNASGGGYGGGSGSSLFGGGSSYAAASPPVARPPVFLPTPPAQPRPRGQRPPVYVLVPPVEVPPVTPEVPVGPSPIPLPASVWLLAGALGLLTRIRSLT